MGGKYVELLWHRLNRNHVAATAALAVLVVLNLAVQRSWRWDPGFFAFELIFGALTIILPLLALTVVAWVRNLACPLEKIGVFADQTASMWLDDQLRRLLARWAPVAAGVALAVIGLVPTVLFWIPWRGWVGGLFFVWAGLFFLGYGVLVWSFGALLVLIWRISNLPVQCSPFMWPTSHVYSVYRTYLKILILGAVVYGLAVLSVWISPSGSTIATQTRLGMLWVFPPAACIILFFLAFHFCIHKLLLQYKQTSDDELTMVLDAEYAHWRSDPAAERADRINSLLEWRDSVRKADEWPLRLRSVLLMITTLLIPTIKVLFDLIKG